MSDDGLHDGGAAETPPKPRVIAPNASKIPAQLKAIRQWLVWKLEFIGERWTKVPYNPSSGAKASSTDPETWSDFDAAVSACQRGGYSGVGFVVTPEDPFCGIDIDGCVQDGKIAPWALEPLQRIDSYAEFSPSGKGIRIWTQAALPRGPKGSAAARRRIGQFEMYDTERFLTVTGAQLDGSPAVIRDCQETVEELHRAIFRKQYEQEQAQPEPRSASPAPPEIDRILQKARGCRSGSRFTALFDQGQWKPGYGSPSEADLALCNMLAFWCGPDAALIDQCFRASGLMREKWSARQDYREATIANAIEGCKGEFYEWNRAQKHEENGQADEAPPEQPEPEPEPEPLRPSAIGNLMDIYPKLREPVIEGLVRAGEVVNVISKSKVGKSWFIYGMGLSVVMGDDWLGRYRCTRGKVLLLDNELHFEDLAHRIPTVANAYSYPAADWRDDFEVLPLRGRLRGLFELESFFRTIRPGTYRLIIVDALYRILPDGASENDNALMARVYNQIDRYAEMTGSAFALVHHATKGSQSDKDVTDVGAGAGSQSRAADTHLILRQHEEENCAVLDAALRSWAPVEPFVLRWHFPVWMPDEGMDPTKLKGTKQAKDGAVREAKLNEKRRRVVDYLMKRGPAAKTRIRDDLGISYGLGEVLISLEETGDIRKCKVPGNNKRQFDGYEINPDD